MIYSSRWKCHLWAVLGYAAIAVVFTWPLVPNITTHLTGSPAGDTGVYVWNQWVFHHELVENRSSPYFTDKIFSLSGRANLSLHNYTAFQDLVALPFIPWLGVVATFNLVYLLMTGADRVRHVPARPSHHRWHGGGVARGPAVCLEPDSRDSGRRTLQPGGGGAAGRVPAPAAAGCRTTANTRCRGARCDVLLGGKHRCVLRGVLRDHRRRIHGGTRTDDQAATAAQPAPCCPVDARSPHVLCGGPRPGDADQRRLAVHHSRPRDQHEELVHADAGVDAAGVFAHCMVRIVRIWCGSTPRH